MNAITSTCVIMLLLAIIVGLITCVMIARAQGRAMSVQIFLLINYMIVQPLSGIVHLTGISSGFRGYYDLNNRPIDQTLISTFAAVIGLFALCVAFRPRLSTQSDSVRPALAKLEFTRREAFLVTTIVAVLAPVTLFALAKISAYAASAGSARLISLDAGTARFSFMSDWIVWVISLIALLLVLRRRNPSPPFVFVTLAVAVACMGAALSWSGGRSVVLLMAFPLVYVLWPLLRGLRGVAVVSGGASLIAFVVAMSAYRLQGTAMRFNISGWNWIDWEWGRFSMTGMAAQHVSQQGLLYGETLARGITSAPLSALAFIGFPVAPLEFHSSMAVTSRVIKGDFESIYMVPGLTSELYINFGILGVAAGYYLIGRVAKFVDSSIVRAESPTAQLMFAFIGSLLIFRSILADSASPFYFFLYSGFPLLALFIINSSGRLGRGPLASVRSVGHPPRDFTITR